MKPGAKTVDRSAGAQLKDYWAKIRHTLAKHFGFLFIVLSLFALLYAAYQVQQHLHGSNMSSEPTTASKDYSTNFNKATIEKINSLESKSSTPLPPGRTNPFSE